MSESDSIYQAPSSDTSVAPTDDLMAAYAGPKNAHFYLNKFSKMESGGGWVSWNWPAFFVTWFWLMYRKMWAWSFVYWLGMPIAITLITVLLGKVAGPVVSGAFYSISYIFIMFILAPMIVNRLYFGHVKGKVARVSATSMSAEQQAAELARIGGTSKVVFILAPLILIMLIGILAAIAIPAYQDYTIRAQVSEGLNLSGGAKAAVTESYQDSGSLPANNAAAGLASPEAIYGNYVSSVAVYEGTIVVTYGESAHVMLQDETIELVPDTDTPGLVNWICYSPTIANKHLPSACRR